MCEFVSWIEYKDTLYFLTARELATQEGRALRKYLGTAFLNDVCGHGAIRHYYQIPQNKGRNHECTDFSSPDNFPAEIAAVIKAGDFIGVGFSEYLLTKKALAEYERVRAPARAEYERVRDRALDECERVRAPALAEYERVRGQYFWKLFADLKNRIEAWR